MHARTALNPHCQTISTFAPSLQIITLYLGSALIKAMKVNVILRSLLFLTFLVKEYPFLLPYLLYTKRYILFEEWKQQN
jgi:hypothetical protein